MQTARVGKLLSLPSQPLYSKAWHCFLAAS